MFRKVLNAILGWFGLANDRELSNHQQTGSKNKYPPSVPDSTIIKTPPSPVEKKLYQGKAFTIPDKNNSELYKYLFKKDDSGKNIGPTHDQLKVIFSDSAATAVLAGAGSGKSTTLVSRLLFLYRYMDVPFENMAVFTYTKKSRKDFIDKLLNDATRWEINLTRPRAERLVRTFHSKALQIARDIIRPEERFFEFLGKNTSSKVEQTKSRQEIGLGSQDALTQEEDEANQIEGLFRLEDESEEQVQIFRDTYAECYNKDSKFKKAIATLVNYTIATEPKKPDHHFQKQLTYLDRMQKIDPDLCNHLENRWEMQGGWPINGIATTKEDGSRFSVSVMGTPLLANGYIEKLDIYVFLDGYKGITKSPLKASLSTLKPEYDVHNKKIILLAGSKNKIRFIKSTEDALELQEQLELLLGENGFSAPMVKLRLPGEFKTKPAYSALYSFGVFVENLGLPPEKIANNLPASFSEAEQAAMYAVSQFFGAFYETLKKNGLTTFNEIFSRLSKGSKDLEKVGISSLAGINHLMIDEFQDISPLIVEFILGLHSELVNKSDGTLKPSLMCVGDDWQSIYGWRGSSPHFFLEFHKHFPGALSEPIRLQENFRSSQKIIDCGESFIKHVQKKSQKRGIAANNDVKDLPWPVVAIEKYTSADVKIALERLFIRANQHDDIYLLAASHNELKPFLKITDPRFTATTFHQSKGLEAEYVVLLGAPNYFGSNPLKNYIYSLAKFPQTFDEAQRDEAFRVAYVAATRAKRLCLWFATPRPRDVISTVSPNAKYRQLIEAKEVGKFIDSCT